MHKFEFYRFWSVKVSVVMVFGLFVLVLESSKILCKLAIINQSIRPVLGLFSYSF